MTEKTFIRVPERAPRSRLGALFHSFKGPVLGPLYWAGAALAGGPGLGFRWRALRLALRSLMPGGQRLSAYELFHLLFMPMESTRYFEFDFAWQALAGRSLRRCLDVSSPRLLPVSLLAARPDLRLAFLNPDADDLAQTRGLLDATGLAVRAELHHRLITDLDFEPGSYDAVLSISVLEHIPEDREAVETMWRALRPGGVLVLTVPASAKAEEQFIDLDHWGILDRDEQGYVFWQRLYDLDLLRAKVFAVTGEPAQLVVFGEVSAGMLQANSQRKRADAYYPYWREPLMMAREFRRFAHPGELPGEGVVGLVFEKPA